MSSEAQTIASSHGILITFSITDSRRGAPSKLWDLRRPPLKPLRGSQGSLRCLQCMQLLVLIILSYQAVYSKLNWLGGAELIQNLVVLLTKYNNICEKLRMYGSLLLFHANMTKYILMTLNNNIAYTSE